MSDQPIVQARRLTKRYGARTAVDELDLAIKAGEVFGILGPNGSGKTTTILMLLGLTDVTSGSVEIAGLDPTREPLEVKRVVGYMPDTVGFYDHLTARENLTYTARLMGIPRNERDARIDEALSRVRLLDVAEQRTKTFSRGMRQRLGLAEVIMKKPRLAILDEPTSGLDPQSSHEFLELITALKEDGTTFILSSHLLDRVQAICDRVALFQKGKIVLEGKVDELSRQILGGGYLIDVEAGGRGLDASLAAIKGVRSVKATGERHYRIEADRDVRGEVVLRVAQKGGPLMGLAVIEPSLDEIYNRYFEEHRDAA